MDESAAIDRQRSASNEIRLVGRQKGRRVCDVPRGAHLVAQRHAENWTSISLYQKAMTLLPK